MILYTIFVMKCQWQKLSLVFVWYFIYILAFVIFVLYYYSKFWRFFFHMPEIKVYRVYFLTQMTLSSKPLNIALRLIHMSSFNQWNIFSLKQAKALCVLSWLDLVPVFCLEPYKEYTLSSHWLKIMDQLSL